MLSREEIYELDCKYERKFGEYLPIAAGLYVPMEERIEAMQEALRTGKPCKKYKIPSNY